MHPNCFLIQYNECHIFLELLEHPRRPRHFYRFQFWSKQDKTRQENGMERNDEIAASRIECSCCWHGNAILYSGGGSRLDYYSYGKSLYRFCTNRCGREIVIRSLRRGANGGRNRIESNPSIVTPISIQTPRG